MNENVRSWLKYHDHIQIRLMIHYMTMHDEPTSSLDDENCERVIKLLKKQASDFNAQLIVITHDNRLKKHFKKSIKL